jgi:asparagine synthase (glutamine-hydrolysing)
MCGFAGFLQIGGLISEHPQALAHAMASQVAHRGPDDAGVWCDAAAGMALAHQRLAIVDVSAAGHQPMVSHNGQYVLAFNGEIYNHLALRAELHSAGHSFNWRGHSDTETLLACVQAWGLPATLKRCVGMFAFALWDRNTRSLTLARDRLGEKPLYYGWQGSTFLFGSELKALKAHPAFCAAIDRHALSLMMRHSAIPAPYSIYQGIHKLLPGTTLLVHTDQEALPIDAALKPQRYWDARQAVAQGIANPYAGTLVQATAELDSLLRQAVAQQMVADVPLGAFLSGGVDSSTIVALMQAQSMQPVRTFTIGFHEDAFNEAPQAKAVAQHLGTDHTELYISAHQAMDVIPKLPGIYCEPFADSSQIPTYLVSQLARQHVTVSLSGDGGDELFGGYSRYALSAQLWRRITLLPMPLRKALASAMLACPPQRWNSLLDSSLFSPVKAFLGKVMPALAGGDMGHKLHKGASVLTAESPTDLYRLLVSHWQDPAALVLGATEPPTVLTDIGLQPKTDHFVHQMMALDLLTYLPDDILTKVDRAAMAVGLETRVPMLDHRVVEFAWQLPIHYKINSNITKLILGKVLENYLPPALTQRPKMGFGIPLGDWLRGSLRAWAEDLLSEKRLQQEGFFAPALVRQTWQEHLSGQRNWQYPLWNVLMFQAWLQEQGA